MPSESPSTFGGSRVRSAKSGSAGEQGLSCHPGEMLKKRASSREKDEKGSLGVPLEMVYMF